MKCWFWWVIVISGSRVSGQPAGKPAGTIYTGATAYSIRHGDVFSFTGNQGSFAQPKEVSIALYGERRFFLPTLNDCQGVLSFPVSSGNFGLHARYYGFPQFNESGIGLLYARHLGEKVSAGVQFNYHNTGIAGYRKLSSIAVEGGVIFHLPDGLNAGIQISNPPGIKLGEKPPFVFTAGIGYDASEVFFIGLHIAKEEEWPVSVNLSSQYYIFSQLLMIRAAFASATATASIGVGCWWNEFRFDLITNLHPRLGLTPGIMVYYLVKKKKGNERY